MKQNIFCRISYQVGKTIGCLAQPDLKNECADSFPCAEVIKKSQKQQIFRKNLLTVKWKTDPYLQVVNDSLTVTVNNK